MSKFIQDMIHMSEGEKLIHYWWLWAAIIIIVFGSSWISSRKNTNKN